VRVATVNLLHGRSLTDGIVDIARMRTAVAELGADVLGLQEVDRNQPRSHGADLTAEVAAAVGAVEHRFEPALRGTPGEAWVPAAGAADADAGPAYGIGLVSRVPVRRWEVIRLAAAPVRSPLLLPGTRQWIWLADEPRVGLAAVVDHPTRPGTTMTIATTHLSFVPGWNAWQLRHLLRALRQLPQPVVLLGDLNLPAPLPRLVAPGWRPLATAATWPAPGPRVQFDHVLGHGAELPTVTGSRTVEMAFSDHRALLVDLG
jgi:endonuclease/exonuclease/phosphatase family metal-dependent hydrolase